MKLNFIKGGENMAEYIEYHPLKFWLDPASIAEIVAHIQKYLVDNPINSTTEIETIIHDYLIAHPELIGGVDSVNGQTGEVVLTADNISGGENVTIKDVLDSLQDQIDDIVASIPSDYQQLIDDVSDLKSALDNIENKTLSNLVYSSVIPTVSGQSIFATYHVFDTIIPANTPFTFRINDSDETIGIYNLYGNGSALKYDCSTNTDYSFTRTNEITFISIYCSSVAKTGSVKAVLAVKNNNTNIEDTLSAQETAIDDLDTEFDEINSIFNTDFVFQTYSGGYIRANNGEVASNANTGYTDYIDVSGYDEISCPVDYSQTHQMAFYDADKVYVSGEQKSGTAPYVWTLQVPNNARYARLSFYLSVQDSFYVHGVFRDIKKYINDTVDTALNDERSKKLEGKKLGIVGDSISTFQEYIPEGYTPFYPRNTVLNVDQTWWKQLLDETGMELCVNASWSGSTITGDTTISSGYVGCSDARVNALTDGSGNKPDIIIVWMGINDFGKTNGRTCGTYDGTTAVTTASNVTSITDAFGVLLKKLETAYPNARIFVCRILPEQFAGEMADSYANGFPNINPDDNVSLPELNERIEKIANAFGCGVIPMDKCGATFYNINTYTGDGLHPNALLTPKMCEIAKEALLNIM